MKHRPEPVGGDRGDAYQCRHCGRQLNIFKETRDFTEQGLVVTRVWRHNPPRGVPHPRRGLA